MNECYNRRFRYVYDVKDINYILKIAGKHTKICISEPDLKFLDSISFVKDALKTFEITTKYVKDIEHEDGLITYEPSDDYKCTWIFDKTGDKTYKVHPSIIGREVSKYYKIKNIVRPEKGDVEESWFDTYADGKKILQSARPILGFNPKYDKTEHEVYCYDLNSAYAAVLRNKIIDTWNYRFNDYINENEVGFQFDDNLTMVTDVGEYAYIIFPLIDSPYREFCDKWYKIKKESPKGSKEKAESKQYLNISVGLMQNINPFLRAYVINSCNAYIQNIVDKNSDYVCSWNTDSVYSTKPLDLSLGKEIGQFKLEYHGLFRQKGNNYQKVDDNDTSYRGIPKILFKKGWNILTDPLPLYIMPYKYNKETNCMEENDKYVK